MRYVRTLYNLIDAVNILENIAILVQISYTYKFNFLSNIKKIIENVVHFYISFIDLTLTKILPTLQYNTFIQLEFGENILNSTQL